jgi:predicted transcriptional regulator
VELADRGGDRLLDGRRAVLRELRLGLLVASDEPLKRIIPLLVESPHRLVVQGTRIEGIVTSSDVHKLPVRLLAFALVTHL